MEISGIQFLMLQTLNIIHSTATVSPSLWIIQKSCCVHHVFVFQMRLSYDSEKEYDVWHTIVAIGDAKGFKEPCLPPRAVCHSHCGCNSWLLVSGQTSRGVEFTRQAESMTDATELYYGKCRFQDFGSLTHIRDWKSGYVMLLRFCQFF